MTEYTEVEWIGFGGGHFLIRTFAFRHSRVGGNPVTH